MPAQVNYGSNVDLKADMRVSLDIQLKTDVDKMRKTLTLSSVVDKLLDDNSILIHMPMYQGTAYPLPRDEVIVMKFATNSEMYSLPVEFVDQIMHNNFLLAKMLRLGKIEAHQQRDCYRLPCSIPVTIGRMWYSETYNALDFDSSGGEMINLSDGGMLFSTNETFEKGDKLTLTFAIGTVESVEAVVLRTENDDEGMYQFRVAAQFRNNDIVQKRRIYKYIVNKQLEERRRRSYSQQPLHADGNKRRKRW